MSYKLAGLLVPIAVAAIAACSTTPPGATVPTVRERVLDNGLRVLVKTDDRAPVVVSQVWYKVGGSYEPDGLSGISHVLEHMMFKGTKTLAPNEFSRIIAENGGRENAFTGRDYTAYFQTLESSRLEVSFKLEADRMQNLVLDPAEFAKEIEVVKEERRLRTEDQPEALAYERFMATAFAESTYRNPIIGWPRDLASMNVAELRDWYARFYAPNNATVVVAGDVDPDVVFDLAEKYFGKVPRRQVDGTPNPSEPPQTETRRVTVRAPAQVPYLIMGYHVPVIGSAGVDGWEPFAIDMLAYVLDGGKSARFATELIRNDEVAASVNVSYDSTARKPTLFIVDANPAQGRNVNEVQDAIVRQIERLQTELVSPEELDRVKAQIIASNVYERDSVFYQAMKLGTLETNGLSWRIEREFIDRLRAVTPEQIRTVARKYLVNSNLTIGVLEPETSGARPEA